MFGALYVVFIAVVTVVDIRMHVRIVCHAVEIFLLFGFPLSPTPYVGVVVAVFDDRASGCVVGRLSVRREGLMIAFTKVAPNLALLWSCSSVRVGAAARSAATRGVM